MEVVVVIVFSESVLYKLYYQILADLILAK